MKLALVAGSLLLASSVSAPGGEESIRLAARDGYELPARITTPETPVRQVVVLVHGSGPNGMDHDLTAVSAGDEQNLLFRDVAQALVAEGIAVLRYDKRTHRFREELREKPEFRKSAVFLAFEEEPLQHLIDDVGAMVDHARRRFPEAQVVVAGFSQGTYLGLQSAHAEGKIDALVLVGFYASSLETVLHEQTVYRSLKIFRDLDANDDDRLVTAELKKDDSIAASLLAQLPFLDLDEDESYSRIEFQAAHFSNLLARDTLGAAYRAHEAALPRVADILAKIDVPVLFFQGEWDNQTPAYHTRAVQVANRLVWGRANLSFRIFPERGHVLDPRESYDDLIYRPADPAILTQIADAISALRPEPTPEE
jgi:hypothetical protein